MAYIFPSDITQAALAGALGPELETLRQLKDHLAAAYRVYHGVHWSHEYARHTVFGEIDFVVVNADGALLVIEQKNGPLEETPRGLVKSYSDGETHTGDQIRRSLENLREKYKRLHGKKPPLQIDYLLYCPDHRVQRLSAAALDPSRIVHAGSEDTLAARIELVLGPGQGQGEAQRKRIESFLRQTLHLVPDIHAHLEAQQKRYIRLTGGLTRVLSCLEMKPLRLRVQGTAGSGKSLVARHFFAQALERGQRPLLVCFNRPLRERLNASVPAGGRVETFYGLADKFLKDRGQPQDFSGPPNDPSFWKDVQEKVIAEPIPDSWKFDTLIVDEGQDFEPEWFEILRLFLKERADILWLEDADQRLNSKPIVELDGFVGFRARENYRSPQTIARAILRMLPFEFEPVNDLPGLGVHVTGYREPEEQVEQVETIIKRRLKQGFTYEDVVILTTKGLGKTIFFGRGGVGRFALRQFTGEYDLFGNQIMTPGRILFDSVFRFKGQQAPAVILVDVDPPHERQEFHRAALFCGMTRATVVLDIVAREGNWIVPVP